LIRWQRRLHLWLWLLAAIALALIAHLAIDARNAVGVSIAPSSELR
jgi:hypothetical protein